MPAEPRTAAACVIVRGDTQPEVLLAKRSPALRFMAGHHVFPGGRVHESESVNAVVHATDQVHARAIHAVTREVFEETGLLCVRGTLPSRQVMQHARRQIIREELNFGDFLAQHGLSIDAADFEPAGEWLTPSFVPIRFATRYFLYHLRGSQPEELLEGEIVGLDWLTPAEARARWHRGEIRLSTPVAYTLRQLAAVGLPRALPLLARGTERVPGEHNWFEIRRGITLVPVKSPTIPPATHTNCLIVGEDAMYVIDPGAADDEELGHLRRQIDHLIELGGRVEAILLTHSHPDHTRGADQLRQTYDVPILAHAATAGQVSFKIDRHLQDDEVLLSGGPRDAQWRLRCIHTPGHDPGHLCFLEESTKALLAGDMLANPGSIVVSRKYGGDMAAFMQSLEKLLTLDCKLIIPAHGHPAGRPHEFIQQQLDHRLWREAKIKRAYDEGSTTFDQLLATAYDDIPQPALRWARHSLDAHLVKLGIELPTGP
ncbi:MAG TPA: MBL fold metallo-hydrolase [Planctomycetaceae bacterium]|jgi:glyoxylase-like metal-dependent hydrolase (beta-lactamase superfamily II)/8-oxo-dGTP pyrophosphatase MutT (NUDIX family)|nr:MBL fold metallo-hydrolase [Planctomycetaceae bacterium]